jgi:type IV pilus assembly protein PilX
VIRNRIPHRFPSGALPTGNRGFVLIIALIVLAAMSLAAVALVRTVDTATLLARNISFKRDALNRNDVAIDAALTLFMSGNRFALNANTNTDDSVSNYSAVLLPSDTDGVPTILKNSTSFASSWTAGPVAATANSQDGMTAVYLIERMCSLSGPSDETNCLLSVPSAAGGTMLGNRPKSISSPLFRVTAKVTGPRNTVAYVQTIFTL